MKKSFKYIFGFLMLGSVLACKKDLDINTNPNAATSSTPNLVLPQAIVATAANVVTYNNSLAGSQVAGFFANSAGVSGWTSIVSYNYLTSDAQNLWNNTYNILNDIEYVLNKTEGDEAVKDFNAAAKVLKAYNFAMLVDVYNDAPYTEALKADKVLQPKYDDAKVIYKNLADLLDQAIATFTAGATPSKAFSTADPLFGSASATEFANWARFANSIKLRLVVKGKDKGVTFSNTTFNAIGFLQNDALVQPGYSKTEGKQNPMWNAWAYSAGGAAVAAASNYVVTPWIITFYNGTKLLDENRAKVVFKNGLSTSTNQLGYLPTAAETASKNYSGLAPSNWFIGTSVTDYSKIGILKGPDAPQPLMLKAESDFLQAEANIRGIVSGTALTNFENGIKASYAYLYKNNAGAITAGKDVDADFAAYKAANLTLTNPLGYLVNFSSATSDAQRMEAIITQKYLAFNMIFGHEAFNEYKRTGYPTITVASTDRQKTFVSLTSQSTAPDKLPTRLMYPESEFKFNASNVPNVNKFSSKIFWAK